MPVDHTLVKIMYINIYLIAAGVENINMSFRNSGFFGLKSVKKAYLSERFISNLKKLDISSLNKR